MTPLRGAVTLLPEKSWQWNLALQFAPDEGFLRGLNVNAVWWKLKISNRIGSNAGPAEFTERLSRRRVSDDATN